MKNKKKIKSIQLKSLNLLIPKWLFYLIVFIWFWFVFSGFFKNFSPDISYFLSYIPVSFNFHLLLKAVINHLANVSITIFFIVSSLGLGGMLAPRLKFVEKTNTKESFFIFTILGIGVFSIFVFFTGVIGLLNKYFYLGVISPFFIYGIILLVKNIVTPKLSHFSLIEKIGLILILLIGFINLIGALTPETFYDSQFYLLGLPAQWILNRKITSDIFIPPSFFPFNINMIYTLLVLLGNEVSAKLFHFFSGLFVAFGVYIFCKKYFSRKVGVFAALIFYSVPLVMLVSWKTAIELGIGLFEFAMIFALVNYVNELLKKSSAGTQRSEKIVKNTVEPRKHETLKKPKLIFPFRVFVPSWLNPSDFFANKWLLLSGVFCGFSLGSKYTSLAFCFLPAIVSIFVFNLFSKESIKTVLARIIIFVVVSFVVSSPWFVRNLLLSGNPVFPFFSDKIGHLAIRGGNLFADPPHPKFTLLNYFGFLWPMTMGTLQQETYPGPIFLLFVPLILVFRNVDKKIKFLLLFLSFAVVLWAVFGRFYLRYFIPTLPVASIIFAYFIVNQDTANFFRNLCLLVVFYVTLNNLSFASRILKDTQDPLNYVLGNISKKEYLSTQRPSYPAPYYQTLSWANENLPKDAKIIFLGETRGLYSERVFFTSGAGDYSPFVEKLKKVKDAKGFYEMLRKEGITHILFNGPEAKRLAGYEPFYFDENDLKVFDDFWRKHVREVYRDIADIYLPQYGISSMKREQPDWWKNYAADPKNYVYIYEILPEDIAKEKPVPFNFLLLKDFYPDKRWLKIRDIADKLKTLYSQTYL